MIKGMGKTEEAVGREKRRAQPSERPLNMQKCKGGGELIALQGSIKPLAVISAYSGILIAFLTVCSQCLLRDSRRRELHLDQLSK